MKKIFKHLVLLSLEKEAGAVLKKYKPKIIAITGTVGKTSTKDAVATALSRFVFVRKSPKNLNTEIGVPLSILNTDNPANDAIGWIRVLIEGLILLVFPTHYPEWLVLEVGTDQPGDIARITRWLSPDIVIVTKLSKVPVHVEAFPTPEDLFNEKGNLVRALKPGGTLILNADDEDVLAYKNLSKENIVLFGNASELKASAYKVLYDEDKKPEGVSFEVVSGTETVVVIIKGTLGEQHMSHVLAAFAVCSSLHENLTIAAKAFLREAPTPGRMRVVDGMKGSTILDDTYNSSPVAVEEALKTLGSLKAKRKIAVLGDMLELGKYSVDEHKKVGENVAKIADILVTIGVRSRYTAEEALSAGMKKENVFQFDNSHQAATFLKAKIEEGDIILVKGSQSIRTERVVEAIMAYPKDREKLLVRQDKEWRKRN
jgi:UDP-N-acetylmuramoyl-tripeptide--D-alanyl-D-alanine ligase